MPTSDKFNLGSLGLRSLPWLRRLDSRNPMQPTSGRADTARIHGIGKRWRYSLALTADSRRIQQRS